MNFKSEYIQEQNLVFGDMKEEKDPRLGLSYFGPFRHPTETTSLENLKLGIVANKTMLEKAKEILSIKLG